MVLRLSTRDNPAWTTPSISNGNGGSNCVECARFADVVAVRDSKHRDGPTLFFTMAEWAAFVGSAKLGEFDL